jgi:hypothetical protein
MDYAYASSMTVISLFFLLIVGPAAIGYCLYVEGFGIDFRYRSIRQALRSLLHQGLQPGDFLIYRKPKVSCRPGPRARNIEASEKGDDYYYEVDKYWTVADVRDDELIAITRTGKHVHLQPHDVHLRKAGLVARILHRNRFPSL